MHCILKVINFVFHQYLHKSSEVQKILEGKQVDYGILCILLITSVRAVKIRVAKNIQGN